MQFEERKIQFQNIPALLIQQQERRPVPVVLVYHGLGANKEVQRKEMYWLAEAGFKAVGIDAPHHGERADGFLEKLEAMSDEESHNSVMQLVSDAIREIPFIVSQFETPVGITGISLGGYITFGAVMIERRIRAAVPILGAPEAAGNPQEFAPCALFASNAGKDIHVPSAATGAFMKNLEPYYAAYPERLKYVEYPESGHFMREEDWNDLWTQLIGWFDRFLRLTEIVR